MSWIWTPMTTTIGGNRSLRVDTSKSVAQKLKDSETTIESPELFRRLRSFDALLRRADHHGRVCSAVGLWLRDRERLTGENASPATLYLPHLSRPRDSCVWRRIKRVTIADLSSERSQVREGE